MRNLLLFYMLTLTSLPLEAASLPGGGGGGFGFIDNTPESSFLDELYLRESENNGPVIRLDLNSFDEVNRSLDSKVLELKLHDQRANLTKQLETPTLIILKDEYGSFGRIEKVNSKAEETTGILAIDDAKVSIEITDSFVKSEN